MQYSSLIPSLIDISLTAGEILMKHFSNGITVERKGDNSPVTEADREADILISTALSQLTPEIPVISEEGDLSTLPQTNTYWLVDPLDGTRSFIKNEPEFTVNIGLIENNRATQGVIYAPALNTLYFTNNGKAYKYICVPEQAEMADEIFAQTKSGKAYQIKTSSSEGQGLRVIASKNHRNEKTDEYIKTLNVKEFIASASSYKFCLVAEGAADVYPRFGNTMQWDTAAGQAILEAAGGKMQLQNGGEFLYKLTPGDSECLRNPHFIASN